MNNRVSIAYGLLWVCYFICTYSLFPYWPETALIPALPLLGLGGWLFGSTKALLLVFPTILYQYSIYNIFYPENGVYFEDRAIGPLLIIAFIYLSSAIRKNKEMLSNTNEKLEQTIHRRSQELNQLAQELIERAEQDRIQLGAELHDGIGQELTGIQLYCGALAEQLAGELNPSASLAFSLRRRAATAHNLIRSTSRTLFPVKLAETGLPAALEELVSCLEETKHITISIERHDILKTAQAIPSLALYRICQESALYILNNSSADNLQIRFSKEDDLLNMSILYNGPQITTDQHFDIDASIIKYRLKQVGGEMHISNSMDNEQQVTFSIPTSA